MPQPFDDKQEAIKQWTKDPCGKVGAQNLEVGTLEFYERINQNRYEEYATWLKDYVNFKRFAGKKVLEIGFGMSTDLMQFAEAGAEVWGIDLSPMHLDISQKRFALYGYKANLQLADAENMPFAENAFDTVYSFGVIHHTPDTQKAADEIYRVLKPGGKAIIGLYHKNSAFYYFVLMAKYILLFRFLRESYRRTLSRIEYREHSEACPLVKLYTLKTMADLFSKFGKVQISCHHLDSSHFGPFKKMIPQSLVKKLEPKLGWYIMAECTK
ncbi:hypothetical protein MASR2M18_14420 [Ignavibacteria bacterium]|nr:class I SAM-dependent methyltransferase [Bacteroidota bacterium]MCZ2132356.1 class I SAM-dependent methyltransferase [Bacteroidota bacterium]